MDSGVVVLGERRSYLWETPRGLYLQPPPHGDENHRTSSLFRQLAEHHELTKTE